MIKSADGSVGLLHRITKPTAWREGVQKKEGRWIVAKKKRGENGQVIGNVKLMCKIKRAEHRKSLGRMKNWRNWRKHEAKTGPFRHF